MRNGGSVRRPAPTSSVASATTAAVAATAELATKREKEGAQKSWKRTNPERNTIAKPWVA